MPRIIDTNKWYRHEAYEFFKGFDDPFFNLVAAVDVTRLRELCRQHQLSFNAAVLYYSQQTANSIPEFRTRISDKQIVEYESVEATQTLLQDDESFTFCYFQKSDSLTDYCRQAEAAAEKYKSLRTFDVETERLDLVYYSVIPWVSFTSFKHATVLDPSQSVPRIVFGKFADKNGVIEMPVSVEANHIVMDGIHVGKFFTTFQKLIGSCAVTD